MIFREATIADIPSIQVVRNAVKENMLSDPALVPDSDVMEYIHQKAGTTLAAGSKGNRKGVTSFNAGLVFYTNQGNRMAWHGS